MASTNTGRTAEVIQQRERIGAAVLGVLLVWLVYMVGAVPWAVGRFDAIDSELGRVVAATSAVAVAVFALANARTLWRFLRPPVRRLVNYFMAVLPLDVTAERLKQVQARSEAIATMATDVAAHRAGHETEVARLKKEEAGILGEAANPKSALDDATLGRRLNRTQEALARRTEQLEEVRAREEMLSDATEICELCVQRLQASTERYRWSIEIARTMTGIGATGVTRGGGGEAEATRLAEDAALAELAEVDLLMANLDSALYDRKLGDRVAALRIAELRQQVREATAVRVDPQAEGTAPPPPPKTVAEGDAGGADEGNVREDDRRRERARPQARRK